MNFEILKGTKDYESKEQIKINEILKTIQTSFESYGFRPFDTPLIEYFETLTNKYDEDAEIVGEIFQLSDRGNRKLGLRYDLTVPLCRYIASNKQLKKPFKRYQIGKVFRDGPIKKGRLREFIQCDGDVIGISGIEIEAELLKLFFDTYRKIGIKGILEINNNKILRGALLQNNFKEKDLSSIILSIDKLKKIGESGVLKEIEDKGFQSKLIKSTIEILSSKTITEIRNKAKNSLLLEGINELEELINLIKIQNIDYRINFAMSRGLDIYTGNIWEAYDKNEKISSSIGSGGRYDKVIGNYIGSQEEIPACGISFGLIPILACFNQKNQKEGLTNLLIVPLEKELVPKAFELAQKFRDKGENVEISYDYKLKKAFLYTDYLEIEKLIVIGKKDIENGEFILKNLKSKKEEKIKF
ncbi:MAG: histidine--tRNA ligase [Nanoarchaeota archaeon]|nr:histidine--tRNA ligase [Nanoarchaeota archaeon]